VFYKAEGFRWARGAELVREFQMPGAQYFATAFCGNCGSAVPRVSVERNVAVVPAGLARQRSRDRAGRHIFVDSRAVWDQITDDLPAVRRDAAPALSPAACDVRLRDPRTLQLLALYALPIVVAALGWGPAAAAVSALLLALAGIAVATRRDARCGRAARGRAATPHHHLLPLRREGALVPGPARHRIRGSPERRHPGVLLTGRTVPSLEIPPGLTRIGDSPRILRYLWGEYAGRLPAGAPTSWRRRRWRSSSSGTSTSGSATTCASGLLPDLRPARPDPALVGNRGAPRPRLATRAAAGPATPLLRFAVRRMLGVTPARAARALERTREAFGRVDTLLADGRRYLAGDAPSFADITFASLAALAVLPPEYGGRAIEGRRLAIEELEPDWRAEVEAFRARPAGQFVLRLYARSGSHPRLTARTPRGATPRARSPRRSTGAGVQLASARTAAWRLESSSDLGSQTRARITPSPPRRRTGWGTSAATRERSRRPGP